MHGTRRADSSWPRRSQPGHGFRRRGGTPPEPAGTAGRRARSPPRGRLPRLSYDVRELHGKAAISGPAPRTAVTDAHPPVWNVVMNNQRSQESRPASQPNVQPGEIVPAGVDERERRLLPTAGESSVGWSPPADEHRARAASFAADGRAWTAELEKGGYEWLPGALPQKAPRGEPPRRPATLCESGWLSRCRWQSSH
jgi:hypothetical protein